MQLQVYGMYGMPPAKRQRRESTSAEAAEADGEDDILDEAVESVDIVDPSSSPARPQTAKGVPLPPEIIITILGHLKSDGQIRSLTSFQACCRHTYQLARPIIYSDLTVSLLGMRKIRMYITPQPPDWRTGGRGGIDWRGLQYKQRVIMHCKRTKMQGD